jgi:hypothetical protein
MMRLRAAGRFPSPWWGGAREAGIPGRQASGLASPPAPPRKGEARRREGQLHRTSLVLAASLLALSSILDAAAQTKRERAPQEEPEHYPEGPNRENTFYFCTACHSFKIVAAQGMSRHRWNETLDIMVTRHKMPDVQGDEREKMLDYLTTAFPERAQPGWKSPFAPK